MPRYEPMKLEFIRYYKFGQNGMICGIQLEFDNGDQTPFFETELGKQRGPNGNRMLGYEVKSVEVDTSKVVAKIGFKIGLNNKGGREMQGLRLVDQEDEFIVDECWKNDGKEEKANWIYEFV